MSGIPCYNCSTPESADRPSYIKCDRCHVATYCNQACLSHHKVEHRKALCQINAKAMDQVESKAMVRPSEVTMAQEFSYFENAISAEVRWAALSAYRIGKRDSCASTHIMALYFTYNLAGETIRDRFVLRKDFGPSFMAKAELGPFVESRHKTVQLDRKIITAQDLDPDARLRSQGEGPAKPGNIYTFEVNPNRFPSPYPDDPDWYSYLSESLAARPTWSSLEIEMRGVVRTGQGRDWLKAVQAANMGRPGSQRWMKTGELRKLIEARGASQIVL
ncbi:hypothetical protein RQP46_011208 [Phenoliferia psychrophenolica]